MRSPRSLGRAYWFCAGFTLLSALVSVIFSMLAVRITAGNEYALYAASRSVALPLAVVYAMSRRSRGGVAALALAIALVQCFDGFIGFRLQDPSRTYGPIAFAVINLALLIWMTRTQHSLARSTM
jgi:hypothetical protein